MEWLIPTLLLMMATIFYLYPSLFQFYSQTNFSSCYMPCLLPLPSIQLLVLCFNEKLLFPFFLYFISELFASLWRAALEHLTLESYSKCLRRRRSVRLLSAQLFRLTILGFPINGAAAARRLLLPNIKKRRDFSAAHFISLFSFLTSYDRRFTIESYWNTIS